MRGNASMPRAGLDSGLIHAGFTTWVSSRWIAGPVSEFLGCCSILLKFSALLDARERCNRGWGHFWYAAVRYCCNVGIEVVCML
ncbi:hypothetical protein KY284_017496 [Solanum tuberosum]|nr:hypothetical protein KY284_017496 [Solanum tuberosum]